MEPNPSSGSGTPATRLYSKTVQASQHRRIVFPYIKRKGKETHLNSEQPSSGLKVKPTTYFRGYYNVLLGQGYPHLVER
jgi:hypothetical protein